MPYECSYPGCQVLVQVAGEKCRPHKELERHEQGERQDVSAEKKCPLAELCVTVKNSKGEPVGLANVEIVELNEKGPTDQDFGFYDFGRIAPGDYMVMARKDWYLTPDSKEWANKNIKLGESEKKELELILDPVEIHMHLDANRDGNIDDKWEENYYNKWEWGKSKKGTIILCNNDDDYDGTTKKKKADNDDEEINAGNDDKEIAPLELRRKGPEPLDTWKAKLEILDGNENRIRIFEGQSKGDKQILGKGKGKDVELPEWKKWKELKYGMEATQYTDKGFDGEIKLKLTVTAPGSGWKDHEEEACVRVAPWMMMHHLQEAEKVYVADIGSTNKTFRKDLKSVLPGGVTLVERPGSNEQWMQDVMEIGYSCLPTHAINAIIRSPQKRDIGVKVKELLDKDVGYEEPGKKVLYTDRSLHSDFNSFGNLEVTPPVDDATGKSYPFGRIYYGPGKSPLIFDTELETFLEKQIVQRPFNLNTNWLYVGHVDEMLTYVPDGKSYKLFIASPKLAMKILQDIPDSDKKKTLLLKGRYNRDGDSLETSVYDILNSGIPSISLTKVDFETANKKVQDIITDDIIKKLRTEIALTDSQIIEVPVLFYEEPMLPGKHSALTADMVNMLVVNKTCIFPKPFGPENKAGVDLFQDNLEKSLTSLGLIPKPIDDWKDYHSWCGEVHCGTNTMRKKQTVKWWTFNK